MNRNRSNNRIHTDTEPDQPYTTNTNDAGVNHGKNRRMGPRRHKYPQKRHGSKRSNPSRTPVTMTGQEVEELIRKRRIELIKEAGGIGGYLWTETDLDNAVNWFRTTASTRSTDVAGRQVGDCDQDSTTVCDNNETTKTNKKNIDFDPKHGPTNNTNQPETTKHLTNNQDPNRTKEHKECTNVNQLFCRLLQNPGVGDNRPPQRRHRKRSLKDPEVEKSNNKREPSGDDGREPLLSRVVLHYIHQAMMAQTPTRDGIDGVDRNDAQSGVDRVDHAISGNHAKAAAANEEDNTNHVPNTNSGNLHDPLIIDDDSIDDSTGVIENVSEKEEVGTKVGTIRSPSGDKDIDDPVDKDKHCDDDNNDKKNNDYDNSINGDNNNNNNNDDGDDSIQPISHNDNNNDDVNDDDYYDDTIASLCRDILPIAVARYKTETCFYEYQHSLTREQPNAPSNHENYYEENENQTEPSYWKKGETVIKTAYAGLLYDTVLQLRRDEQQQEINHLRDTHTAIKGDGRDGTREGTVTTTTTTDNQKRKRNERSQHGGDNRTGSERFLDKLVRLSRFNTDVCEVFALLSLESTKRQQQQQQQSIRRGKDRGWSGNETTEDGTIPKDETNEPLSLEDGCDSITTAMMMTSLLHRAFLRATMVQDDDDDRYHDYRTDQKRPRRHRNNHQHETTSPDEPTDATMAWTRLQSPLLQRLFQTSFPFAKTYTRQLLNDAVDSYINLPSYVARSAAEVFVVHGNGGRTVDDGRGRRREQDDELAHHHHTQRFESCMDRLKQLVVMDERSSSLVANIFDTVYDNRLEKKENQEPKNVTEEEVVIVGEKNVNGREDRRRIRTKRGLEEVEQWLFPFEEE